MGKKHLIPDCQSTPRTHFENPHDESHTRAELRPLNASKTTAQNKSQQSPAADASSIHEQTSDLVPKAWHSEKRAHINSVSKSNTHGI
jgi:hypothetical protein